MNFELRAGRKKPKAHEEFVNGIDVGEAQLVDLLDHVTRLLELGLLGVYFHLGVLAEERFKSTLIVIKLQMSSL